YAHTSTRIRSEMNSEDASLWFVPANEATEIAALVKAPTASIKVLLTEGQFEFIWHTRRTFAQVFASSICRMHLS
ncbi:MAG TPA: hypothetical protein VMS31_19590, partial [Pyrinomonadaceae bacterium]|nr:hypothetical protein [Pyrinomonadaceae bacterium]